MINAVKNNKIITKSDVILIIAILILIAIFWFILTPFSSDVNLMINVYQNGKLIFSEKLNKDIILSVSKDFVIEISDEQVYVVKSSCQDKICIHMGKINRSGEQIVCLPNKILIKVVGGDVDVEV